MVLTIYTSWRFQAQVRCKLRLHKLMICSWRVIQYDVRWWHSRLTWNLCSIPWWRLLQGFSKIFSSPAYQLSIVSVYLKSIGSTSTGLFDVSGRGFLNIASQAENVEIYNADHMPIAKVHLLATAATGRLFQILSARTLSETQIYLK